MKKRTYTRRNTFASTCLVILTTFLISMVGIPYDVKKGKWVTLFDGKTITGWHSYAKDAAVGWHIEDGLLTPDGTGGDLVTDKEYENFELEFDFKIPPGSNSGVLYKVIEKPEIKRTVFSAPEYQIIDDKGYIWKSADGKIQQLKNSQLSGANYDMDAPTDLTAVKSPGEWNKGRIVVHNDKVEHYLNGTKVVAYVYGNNDWKTKTASSKFADWPYATAHAKGKIALQNHNVKEKVWFRNIRIKELN